MLAEIWQKRIETVFRIDAERQNEIIKQFAGEEADAVRLLVVLSWVTLRQHGVPVARIDDLLTEAVVKMRQDSAGLAGGPKRQPAWIVIDNRFIRYGYMEYGGTELEEWRTINPTHAAPELEDIAMPFMLTIYNLALLKLRMSKIV